MYGNIFPESELLAFSSSRSLLYGNRITIIEESKETKDKNAALALLSSGEQEEVSLEAGGVQGRSFIVLRSWQNGENGFSHHAVPVELMEEISQKIEDSFAELLRTV